MADVGSVVKLAIFSRFVVLVLQVVFNALICDYDSSSSLKVGSSTSDWLFRATLDGFTKWDSVYFLKISEEGYLYEQYLAFFPMYPMVTRFVSKYAFHVIPIFGENTRLLLCGWIISNSSFVASTVALLKLSEGILRNKNLSFLVSVLFCFNPATVFMASLYTESTFACLEFSGLYFMERGGTVNLFVASVLFGLCSATRSNGILSCGFISHTILRALVAELITSKGQSKKTPDLSRMAYHLCAALLKLVFFNSIVLAPFLAYQTHGYFAYCSESSVGVNKTARPWCKKTIPLSYTFIQQHYWNVGFFKYFEMKQIPNFLLASPMIVLCFSAVVSYFGCKENFAALKSLGLKLNVISNAKEEQPKNHLKNGSTFHNSRLFVYIVHLAFITVFGVMYMHVQVVTRFVASSSPVIYWYSAHVISQNLKAQQKPYPSPRTASLAIITYFLLYCIIGITLHCNFYPWT